AHAEQSVLAVKNDLAVARQIVGDRCRQTDAEVHIGAVGDVVCDAGGHLRTRVSIECAFHQLRAFGRAADVPGISTTRRTKIPGVTITSGSSAPSTTISRTCAIAHFAADAMMGPKLRAVLR